MLVKRELKPKGKHHVAVREREGEKAEEAF
jgi:hypothetical protein